MRLQLRTVLDGGSEHRKRRLHRLYEQRVVKALRHRLAIGTVQRRKAQVGLRADRLQHFARIQLVLASQDGFYRGAGPAHAFGQQGCGKRTELLVIGDNRLPAGAVRLACQTVHKALNVKPDQARVARERKQVEAVGVKLKLVSPECETALVPVVIEQDQRTPGGISVRHH